MTRPLQMLNLRLLPPINCVAGQHDGKRAAGAHTAGGTWWACRRCPHTWHVDTLGNITGRKAPR